MAKATAGDWESRVDALLPLFGHRNWIVVADAAYPAQARAGIETIATGAEQVDLLRRVSQSIQRSTHIRANVYVDAELAFVSERDAPGVHRYRDELHTLFAASELKSLQHEMIIDKLDQSAQVFRVLVLKTTMTIPYTSVFFELDCGYWNDEAEQRLRQAFSTGL
jgi:uncharacterized membrane protein YcjF (UPF0283 family)